jgi:hypothetical protein
VKHTSGPWEYHNGDDYTVILGPGDTTERPLAEVYSDRLADAMLIAAAPDLLAVVREACAIFDRNHEGDDEYNGDLASDLWKDEIHRKLTEALAKAAS